MQRVIQRAESAARVAARRKAKKDGHKRAGEAWERGQNKMRMFRANSENIRQARTNRRVDWEAGTLAPRRDVGEKADTYGALDMYDLHLPAVDPKDRKKRVLIKDGDRVVLLKGRDRGRIGTVQSFDRERMSFQVKGLNQVDIYVPEWLKMENSDTRKVAPVDKHVPVEHVRLVYPLPDPETGVPRDVIIDRMVLVPGVGRVIAGTNTVIPYPEMVEPELQDHEDDTLRISVEEQTFRPWLLHPPMPMSVIDELRNKYSRFRTRHEPAYIAQKEAEDGRVEKRKELGKTMRTPLQELAELRARQKKEPAELTPEQLAKIGEVIAHEQSKAIDAVKALR